MNTNPGAKVHLSRKSRAQALRQARRLARKNPDLVVGKHRDEIIVAEYYEQFDGWERYGRHSYPRKHIVCFVTRAGVTGKNWTREYRSITSLRAAYPRIDRAFRAREESARQLENILYGRNEAIVYKTLHVAEDGSLQSPFDGSRWELGVPRTMKMHAIGNKENASCSSGGFFALEEPREHTGYPEKATPRLDRLVVVQCIARNVENLGDKLRAETLCPVGIVLAAQKWIPGRHYEQIHVAA